MPDSRLEGVFSGLKYGLRLPRCWYKSKVLYADVAAARVNKTAGLNILPGMTDDDLPAKSICESFIKYFA